MADSALDQIQPGAVVGPAGDFFGSSPKLLLVGRIARWKTGGLKHGLPRRGSEIEVMVSGDSRMGAVGDLVAQPG